MSRFECSLFLPCVGLLVGIPIRKLGPSRDGYPRPFGYVEAVSIH